MIRYSSSFSVTSLPESPYLPGRTLKWLQVKQKDYRVEERGFYDPERR
jgi:hypothetical protein